MWLFCNEMWMDSTQRIPGKVSHKRTGGKVTLSLPPPSSGLRAWSEDEFVAWDSLHPRWTDQPTHRGRKQTWNLKYKVFKASDCLTSTYSLNHISLPSTRAKYPDSDHSSRNVPHQLYTVWFSYPSPASCLAFHVSRHFYIFSFLLKNIYTYILFISSLKHSIKSTKCLSPGDLPPRPTLAPAWPAWAPGQRAGVILICSYIVFSSFASTLRSL